MIFFGDAGGQYRERLLRVIHCHSPSVEPLVFVACVFLFLSYVFVCLLSWSQ